MTLGALLAVLCIAVGFILAAVEGHFLFAPGTWFLVAIPLVLLGGPVIFNRRKEG